MTDWNEDTIRKAASWRAFKEGVALASQVTEAQRVADGWHGLVRVGKKPYRIKVTFKSLTDVEARCACPENQSTGALCAHAVAVGLAALNEKPVVQVAKADVVAELDFKPMAWEVVFPPKWLDALQSNRLSVTLKAMDGADISDEDMNLSAWLGRQKVRVSQVLPLQLAGSQLFEFLNLIDGHARVIAGVDRMPLAVGSGQRLRLVDTQPLDGCLRLQPEDSSAVWLKLGDGYWLVDESRLLRAGGSLMPESLVSVWDSLVMGKQVNVDLGCLLEGLKEWQKWLEFPDGGWLDSLHCVPLKPQYQLVLDGSFQCLEARLWVVYPDSEPICPIVGSLASLPRMRGGICEVRDSAGEQAAFSRLAAVGFAPSAREAGSWVLKGESEILDFFKSGLPRFRQQWQVLESPRFASLAKGVAIVSPRIEILGEGDDWLRFDLKFQTTDGVDVSVDEVRQILRSSGRAGGRREGRQLLIDDQISCLVEPLFADLGLRQDGQVYEASSVAGEVIKELQKNLHKADHQNELSKFEEVQNIPTLRADLRPYQAQGVAWMWDRVQRFQGALLADDMGLGKTIQTIALIERLFSDSTVREEGGLGVVLVVVTTTLLGNWQREFERFAPGRRVRVLHGSGRDDERERVEGGEVLLTTYGTVARDQAWHLRQRYRAVILDEASLMRNPDTDHAKVISRLNADARVALTGTPVENGVRDLWSIFRFIQPGWLGGRSEFAERYAGVIGGRPDLRELERLRMKVSPFVLRRTKEQVAPELPTKLIIDEICELSGDQKALYGQLLKEGRKRVDDIEGGGQAGAARMQMLTALLRLRQACCDLSLLGQVRLDALAVEKRSGKMVRLLELLGEALDGGHKVLVFSQFQKQLLAIEREIQGRGWESLRLDGKTTNRQALVDRFQASDGPPIFLISLKAGGYGLNLTAADTVIHFDPWWNPAAEAQATDRTHRIGQVRPVTVYRLLTRGTVEEKVVAMQRSKREIAAMVDEVGGGDAGGWSMGDLQSLLEGA